MQSLIFNKISTVFRVRKVCVVVNCFFFLNSNNKLCNNENLFYETSKCSE